MITGYRWRGLFLTTTLFYRYCGVAGVLMRYTIACWLLNKKYESKMAAFAAIRHREAWFVPKRWLKIAPFAPLPPAADFAALNRNRSRDLRVNFRAAFRRLMHRLPIHHRWILNERAPCERSPIEGQTIGRLLGKVSFEGDSRWWTKMIGRTRRGESLAVLLRCFMGRNVRKFERDRCCVWFEKTAWENYKVYCKVVTLNEIHWTIFTIVCDSFIASQ